MLVVHSDFLTWSSAAVAAEVVAVEVAAAVEGAAADVDAAAD